MIASFRVCGLRSLVLIGSFLVLAACVTRPVVVDSYSEALTYEALFSELRTDTKLDAAIDRNLVRVMRPGESVANWTETGTSARGLLAQAPGGKDQNVIFSERESSQALGSDSSLSSLFGADYTTRPIVGSDSAFDASRQSRHFTLVRIGDGVWFETVSPAEHIGNATCSNVAGVAARLHARNPLSSLSKVEKSLLAALVVSQRRNDAVVCGVSKIMKGGGYRSRYFLRDGRRLPVFDREGGSFVIVSKSEAERRINS